MKNLLLVGVAWLCLLVSSGLTFAHSGMIIPIIERTGNTVVADIPVPDTLMNAEGQLPHLGISIYDSKGTLVYSTTVTAIAAIELPIELSAGTYTLRASCQNWHYGVELELSNS